MAIAMRYTREVGGLRPPLPVPLLSSGKTTVPVRCLDAEARLSAAGAR